MISSTPARSNSPMRSTMKLAGAGVSPGPSFHSVPPAGAPAQRGSATPAPQGNNTRPAAAPTGPAQRAGGESPAPQGATAAAGTQNPIAMAPDAAAPLQPAPAAPALGVDPDGGPSGASSAVAAAHTGRGSVRNSHQSPPRRHIPAAVRRHVWHRDEGRCVYRDPLSGRRCTSSHLLQIDHLLPVAEGGGPDPANLAIRCFAHHRMRHGYGPAPPPEPPR